MPSSSSQIPLHRNRWVHLAFGLSVSAICLWLATRELLRDPDAFSKAGSAFAHAKYWTFLPIVGATALFYWLKALRWRLLLKPIGEFQTGRDLFPFVMIGFGLNNVLPIHMGEVVRVLLFARHARAKVSAVASSVVLERVFDSISVLTLLSVGLVFVHGLSPQIRTNTLLVAACVGILVLAMLMYVFWIRQFIATVNFVLSPVVPSAWRIRLTTLLESGVTGLAALRQPRLVAGIMALSLSSWLINGTVIHLALLSFDLPNGLLISCIVLGLTAVGAAVPSAPGYVGVIQLCFMTVLSVFTDDHSSIFAASVYYHLTEYIMVTLTGLFYFNSTGAKLTQIQQEAEFSEEPASELESASVSQTNA